MRILLSILLTAWAFTSYAADPLLTPPKGWNCINDKKELPEKIVAVYVGPTKDQFTPSINIASEETLKKLPEYLDNAKKYHEISGDTQCKSLGTLKTAAGEAQLLQVDRTTQWGKVRFIQAILLHESTAYVVTATCLQKEFALLSPQFFKSIQSLSLKGSVQAN